MPNNVDDKIIRLEFDNKKFEKNVKQSLGTIDRLKKSLNFDEQSKGLKAFQKEAESFTVDDIGMKLEKLEHRFSGFGIAGATVISELTKKAMGLASSLTKAFTAPFEQMKNGGWQRAMNIKDAEFSMKGFGILGDKLTAIKEDINYAVSGTA